MQLVHVTILQILQYNGTRQHYQTLTSQLIEPTDHVPLPYIKTTLAGNSFLKIGENESRDEEEGANLGCAIMLTAMQQCRIDVQHD